MLHKKQAFTLLEDICEINQTHWHNPRGSYNPEAGATLLVEEALEAVGVDDAKNLARSIVSDAPAQTIADVDYFDAMLDTIYVAVGELHKLGLRPSQIVDGLQIVHNANSSKPGDKDSEGKVTKPDGFVGPEVKLQLLLDQRT